MKSIADIFPSSDDDSDLIDLHRVVIHSIAKQKMNWVEGKEEWSFIKTIQHDEIDNIMDTVLSNVDYQIADDLLISFRLWMTCRQFLDKLLFRFAFYFDSQGNEAVKIRLYAFLKRWLTCPWYRGDLLPEKAYIESRLGCIHEFLESEADLKMIESLMRIANPSCESIENNLIEQEDDKQSVKSMSLKNRFKDFISSATSSVRSRKSSDLSLLSNYHSSLTSLDSMLSVYSGAHFILAHSTEDIYHALCSIECMVLSAIDWRDILNFSKRQSHPTVKAAIDHFNNGCKWFVQCVLEEYKRPQQAIQKLIKLAFMCQADGDGLIVKNYNTFVQIMLALQNASVDVMFKNGTVQLGEKDKMILDGLLTLASPLNNFQRLRSRHREDSQLIPFFGLWITDIVVISESVTITDYRRIGSLMRSFLSFQDNCKSDLCKTQHTALIDEIKSFIAFQGTNPDNYD